MQLSWWLLAYEMCKSRYGIHIHFFYMLSSGNDCELSRIGLLTSSVNILE